MKAQPPLLRVSGLSLEFRTRHGAVRVLEDVGFSLRRGESLALVGESGSGKSVTAMAVMGVLDKTATITAGSVVFGGTELLALSQNELDLLRGREMSMIFQNPRAALNPIMRVGDQIGGVLSRHSAVPGAKLREEAVRLLAEVRLGDPESRHDAYPFELSGGMCQRVMIAMALACRPPLLIADEPTTGLDVTTQAAIMDMIAELARRTRMATLLITHDLSLAGEHCAAIAVMHAGHVVEMAPAAELLARPRHPYTAMLLAATPRPDAGLSDLSPIPGQIPDLRRDLPACRFFERCPRSTPSCQDDLRSLEIAPEHFLRCGNPL